MTTTSRSRSGAKSNIQKAAAAVAAVFILVGILGFIPGITTDYSQLGFAGHGSGALLLGLFQVSILHNLVHLLYGLVGLALARTSQGAHSYLLYGGVIYLVLWIYGLVIDLQSAMNFVPLNAADNWLHLFLGIGMISLAFLLKGKKATRGTRSA